MTNDEINALLFSDPTYGRLDRETEKFIKYGSGMWQVYRRWLVQEVAAGQ